MAQLFTSADTGVRKAASLSLKAEQGSQRMTFRPAAMVENIRGVNGIADNRKSLLRAVKSSLAEEEVIILHQLLTNLPAQGEMARCWEHNSPTVWVKAVQMLPSEAMKYSLNATLDTLPTNSNPKGGARRVTTPVLPVKIRGRHWHMY